MSAITELRLTVSRRINLGNYEHVELQATAAVSRDKDDDTPKSMRDHLLDEIERKPRVRV
jgi:hypothetical protein